MKWLIIVIIYGHVIPKAFSQTAFKNLRYTENYSYLINDSSQTLYKKFKYSRVFPEHPLFLSNGGEVRIQLQHFKNEDWGSAPISSYTALYTRLLYHSDLRWKNAARFFIQINHTTAYWRPIPNRSIDENLLDIQQVFADVSLHSRVLLRLGRQELLYGAQRLVSVREGPNNRQSYDAVKLEFQLDNTKRVDIFYSHPVQVQTGVFDDGFNNAEQLWGIYTLWQGERRSNVLEFYYLGFSGNNRRYHSGQFEEVRHSVGSRWAYQTERLNVDAEALVQGGTWGTATIAAYTASINASFTATNWRFEPSFGLKTEVISGDRDSTDIRLNTFNPLYPRGAYFGLAALVGPANLIDFHPSISLSPFSFLVLNADYDFFWRYSPVDGIYGPNAQLIAPAAGNSRFIGHQLGINAQITLSKHLEVTPESTLFFPGNYLRNVTPGERVFFAALTAQFKF